MVSAEGENEASTESECEIGSTEGEDRVFEI